MFMASWEQLSQNESPAVKAKRKLSSSIRQVPHLRMLLPQFASIGKPSANTAACLSIFPTKQRILIMPSRYNLTQLTLYFLKLGTVGFGGPVALIGYMHRDLVENRKWIDE